MKKLLITLFLLVSVLATFAGCDMLAKKDDNEPSGPVTPPTPVVDTIDIKNVSSIYPGYFAYLEYSKGTDEGVTYVCPTGISIEDGKVIVEEDVSIGTYTVTAIKEDEVEEFHVAVKNKQFLNNKSGSIGTDFIDRLNGTLSTIAGANYDEGELVLFAGDSFMDERWFFKDFYTRFTGQNAHLIGVSSSLAEQWVWYGQHLIEYAPKAIVMHVGTNDIFDASKTALETTNILIKMFEAYHNYMPETEIYWLTIEPRLGRSSENGNAKAVEVNDAIIEYAEDKDWLIIADTATAFSQDAYEFAGDLGSIKYSASETTLYGDTVHPSCPVGYDKLMEVVYASGLTVTNIDD